VIIDGVGNNEFLPFCNFSFYLARRKIIRKWTRFIHKLNTKYAFLDGRISPGPDMSA